MWTGSLNPTQILLTILLSIHHFSRCKLKVYITPKRNHLRQLNSFRKIGKTLKVKRVSKIWVRMSTINIHLFPFKIWKKVYLRSQILERPSIGEYWNILAYQYCLKLWYLHSLECTCVIQKHTILECKNGLVLSNACVPVSGTQSTLFPKI